MSDEELAVRAAQGDQDAFGELVTRHRSYVHRIACRITLNEEDAFDVAQDVWIRMIDRLDSYDPSRPFRPWLATVAARVALNQRRANRRREHANAREARNGTAASAPDGHFEDARHRIERNERLALIEDAAASLSPQQRAILLLHLSEDLKPGEIGKVLDIPGKQVSHQLRRAMKKIRDRIAGAVK